jgi:hypothetical protein
MKHWNDLEKPPNNGKDELEKHVAINTATVSFVIVLQVSRLSSGKGYFNRHCQRRLHGADRCVLQNPRVSFAQILVQFPLDYLFEEIWKIEIERFLQVIHVEQNARIGQDGFFNHPTQRYGGEALPGLAFMGSSADVCMTACRSLNKVVGDSFMKSTNLKTTLLSHLYYCGSAACTSNRLE